MAGAAGKGGGCCGEAKAAGMVRGRRRRESEVDKAEGRRRGRCRGMQPKGMICGGFEQAGCGGAGTKRLTEMEWWPRLLAVALKVNEISANRASCHPRLRLAAHLGCLWWKEAMGEPEGCGRGGS